MTSMTPRSALLQALVSGEGYSLDLIDRVKQDSRVCIPFSQVYRDLRELEQDGLVESYDGEPLPERGRRPRRYYKLTEKGRQIATMSRSNPMHHDPPIRACATCGAAVVTPMPRSGERCTACGTIEAGLYAYLIRGGENARFFVLHALAVGAPMTRDEQEEQRLGFVYGNLACSTNHKPTRSAFALIAHTRGWSTAQFDKWAEGRTWEKEEPTLVAVDE